MTAEEFAIDLDPVNLVTGSFSWNYTDMALYGNEDLPFTRYYESRARDRNMGLGYGWTTNFTASLDVEDLYARVILPKDTELYFSRDYDGSFKDAGNYTLC